MQDWWIWVAIGTVAISLISTALVRKVALATEITDVPDGLRKLHKEKRALLGGVAITLVFFSVLWLVEWQTGFFTTGMITRQHLLGVTLAAGILLVHGVIDDKRALAPKWSILATVAASLVVVLFGIEVSKITNPLGSYFSISSFVSDILVFMWIMLLIYTMKLLDGVDGLVTGIGTIASFVIAFLALTTAYFQPDVALLAFIFASTLIGFLAFNFPPATIFLGESGSVMIGFMIAVLAVIGGSKVATALLVMGLPAIDMAAVIIHRMIRRNALAKADRLHLHFKLQDSGFKSETVIYLYWGVSLAFGISTLIFESWQKLIALAFLFIATVIGIIYISTRYAQPTKIKS